MLKYLNKRAGRFCPPTASTCAYGAPAPLRTTLLAGEQKLLGQMFPFKSDTL